MVREAYLVIVLTGISKIKYSTLFLFLIKILPSLREENRQTRIREEES